MFILTSKNDIKKNAYSVQSSTGESVLFLFQDKDDATRYLNQLSDIGHDYLEIQEVDPDIALAVCDHLNYQYAIITPDDIVIPPDYYQLIS
jgi:Protein of unknown function (DUF3110)